MLKLHQTFGAHTGRVLSLGQGRFTLGRRPDCDVQFDPHADLDASGQHAELVFEDGNYWIRDLGSRNGTWIAGQRIDRQVLQGGEELEFGLGGPRLRVEIVAQQAEPVRADEPTQAATAVPSLAPPPAVHPDPTRGPDAEGEKKYGEETMGVMIRSAVERASASRAEEVEAAARAAVDRSSKGLKSALVVMTVLFTATLVSTAVLLGFGWWKVQSARDDARRARADLERVVTEAGERIASGHADAIYLLARREGAGSDPLRGVCTAFAVEPRLLATNAHCVVSMEGAVDDFVAIRNRAPQARLPIVRMWRHPAYLLGSRNPSADVGLVEVRGDLPHFVNLGNAQDLQELSAGSTVYVYGFPGDLSDLASPVATITDGVVGRVTSLDGKEASGFAAAQLIQHSAIAGAGTSGSPIFNRSGVVVAVNAGTLGADGATLLQPGSGAVETGYKYGMRVDLLQTLISGLRSLDTGGTP